MSYDLNLLPILIESHKELLEYSIKKGEYNDISAVFKCRFLAVAEYVVNKEVEVFKKYMRKASEYLICLSENGENLETSSFAEMFIPLALGDKILIKEYAFYLSIIPLKGDFVPLFFLSYSKIILNGDINYDIDSMISLFAKKYKSYTGYGICFKGIINKDISTFDEGFNLIMKYHKRLASTSSIHSLEDQLIALWPLGMVNLARLSGMDVQVNHPLIPPELIVPCQENQFIKQ